ncbi:MAG: flagellar export chaperone FlgN [Phycisphaeraceae bacterium]|nr:flagellar export chaperone FlgN [Phycisphaeraceae bacterium]
MDKRDANTTTKPAATGLDKPLAQLESLLRKLLQAHETLLGLLLKKRQAVRGADQRRITELCHEENVQVQAISEMEKERLKLVAQLTLLVDPKATAPMRLLELADRLPEPMRGRLLVLRQQLRQRMSESHEQTDVIQRATTSLVKHMTGLVQQVTAACTGSSVYGRGGAPGRAPLGITTFSATA